ncbi:hypothetical protein [Nitratireductor rhodophyticola]
MFDWLQYQWHLFKLQRDLRRTEKAFDDEFANARAAENRVERIRQVEEDKRWEMELVRDEISVLVTRYLIARADKMFLPHPQYGQGKDFWANSRQLGTQYLTPKGITEIRNTIRTERADASSYWVTLLSAATGLVGALTGLVAILAG